jgi:Bacteriophage head to tail connecting protein
VPVNPDDLIREYDLLRAERSYWEPTWQSISDTMLPAFNDIQVMRAPGQKRTAELFDSTAMEALHLLSAHLMGSITNFQSEWLKLRMREQTLNDRKEVEVWLDQCADIMLKAMAAGTTPQAFHEKYLQFAGFGTGALYVDESPLVGMGFQGLLSRSLPIGTYVLAEDAAGKVDTLYREVELSPRQAEQQFGKDALSADVRTKLDSADQKHQPMIYIHAVYPRKERKTASQSSKEMPWASCYLDRQNKHIVSEGGYRWFPFVAPRWEKLRTWSPWGFGPGHMVLPETLTLNRMDKDILKVLQQWIFPPYWVDDPDAVGRVSLLPGAINPIARGSRVEAFRPGGDFNVARLGMEERRQRIRRVFMVDQLQSLPEPEATGKMTAFEVSKRIALMQRLMGPALMRLLSEFLNPFIDAVFGLLMLAREFPDPPDVVIMAASSNRGRIDVEYQGPLVRAQKGEEVDAIMGTLDIADRIAMAMGTRDVYDNFDFDDILRRTGKVYGFPASSWRDPKERDQIRAERSQAQQQAMQADQLRQDAQAIGSAAPAMKALMPAQPQEQAA